MEFIDSTYELLGSPFFVPAQAKQMLMATLFGLVFGAERALKQKAASLKTFAFISLGSCVFSLLSVEVAGHSTTGPYDVTRIAAQIVTGIGFVGAGVIFKHKFGIEGITTATMIWMAAAVGMCCGFNRIDMATWAMASYLLILSSTTIMHKVLRRILITKRLRLRLERRLSKGEARR